MITSFPKTRIASAAAALLTTALVLTSCVDSNEETDATTAQTTDRLPAAEGTTQYPLTLETAWGETVLDERPERIVLGGGGQDLDLLASLGVSPIAVADSYTHSGWALDSLPVEIDTTYTYSNDNPLPAEEIALTEPDLIITLDDSVADASFDQVSDVAPVLAPSEKGLTKDWKTNILKIAEALDLNDRAEKVLNENESFFETTRAQYPEFGGKSVAFVVNYAEPTGAMLLNRDGHFSENFFDQLGFDRHPNAQELAASKGTISDELVSQLDADVIIVINQTTDEEFSRFVDSPLFQSIPAVQDGRYIPVMWNDNADGTRSATVDGEELGFTGNIGWALAGPGPLAERSVTEALAPLLSEKILSE